MKVYEYAKCSTCRKARQFLSSHEITHDLLPIAEQAPSLSELKAMAKHLNGDLRKLFNTSGQEYRKLGLKDKLPKLSEDEIYKLLSNNGMLVKRPFAISKSAGTVGFQEDTWKKLFLS